MTHIPLTEILHFIRSYRSLEQLPLQDGFAELRTISPVLPDSNPKEERELKELRQHFRNQWYSKERGFGQFFLNLSHYRQVYLLHHWGIHDWQDAEYIDTALDNPFFRIAGRPPAKALKLHQLIKLFENHGINPRLTDTIQLDNVPTDMDRRFGNSANWGDYIRTLADPEPLLRQLIAYEPLAGYEFDPDILNE